MVDLDGILDALVAVSLLVWEFVRNIVFTIQDFIEFSLEHKSCIKSLTIIISEKRLVRQTKAWERLHRRWNRKYLVDIDANHPRYEELCCVRQGISHLHKDRPDLGPKEELLPEDYNHIVEKQVDIGGKAFKFCSYASPVFSTLRRAVDMSEEEYLQSMAPPDASPYLRFISNSRSGLEFYLSTDKQVFLKTDHRKSVKFFLSILRRYFGHFQSYPHSLLVKFLGLYSVEAEGKQRRYFLVIPSVFEPGDRIEDKYDLKGCFAGRYEQPDNSATEKVPVLMDQNFWRETINLGSQRDWFMRQMRADAALLADLGVVDYSLLIGRQRLRQDERRQSVSDLVSRVQKSPGSLQTETGDVNANKIKDSQRCSTDEEKKSIHIESPEFSARVRIEDTKANIERSDRSLKRSCKLNGIRHHANTPNGITSVHVNGIQRTEPVVSGQQGVTEVRPKLKHKPVSFTESALSDESSDDGNRRLLPNCKNSLHIIDGPEYRYYLGIVDFLTVYGLYHRLDWIRKDIKYRFGDHSTLLPNDYASRFLRFFEERT